MCFKEFWGLQGVVLILCRVNIEESKPKGICRSPLRVGYAVGGLAPCFPCLSTYLL